MVSKWWKTRYHGKSHSLKFLTRIIAIIIDFLLSIKNLIIELFDYSIEASLKWKQEKNCVEVFELLRPSRIFFNFELLRSWSIFNGWFWKGENFVIKPLNWSITTKLGELRKKASLKFTWSQIQKTFKNRSSLNCLNWNF